MIRPLVSIVIPAFNKEEYILDTLKSIKCQTLKNIECIIVDDLSTDNTKLIVLDFIKENSNFKLISHRANSGVNAARNSGLRFCKSKYVCFLDADDLLLEDSIENRYNALSSNDNEKVVGTYCGSVTINENTKLPPKSSPIKLNNIDFITASGNCPFNANQPMFKTEILMKLGGFNEAMEQAEDYEMWIRILRYGYYFIPTKYIGVTYRMLTNSAVRKVPLEHLDNSYKIMSDVFSNVSDIKVPTDNKLITNFLEKGLSDYIMQLNICNRVLEFVGIAISKNQEIGLTRRLINYLPDYFKIIERHRPFNKIVFKGIERGCGGKINDSELIELYNCKINKVYNDFKHKSLNGVAHDNHDNHDNHELSLSLIESVRKQPEIDVVFFPHKDYHIWSVYLMKDKLKDLGIRFTIVDLSVHYRDERVRSKAEELSLEILPYSNFLLGNYDAKLFVSFNDWDPIVRSIMVSAQKSGIKTAAIVEGIQDYDDADTKQQRFAYKTVDSVYLPGEFDKKYFPVTEQNIEVVGLPRIDEMRTWCKNSLNYDKPKALINSNFSYGVLEEFRDSWLTDVVEACLKAGYEPVISRHPADQGTLYKEYETTKSFYSAIVESEVHISKFASGILESLAVGCPVIYFNSHKEKVDKFKDSMGAYSIINNRADLILELNSLPTIYENYLSNSELFLNFHAGNILDSSSVKLVEAINKDVNSSLSNRSFKNFSLLMGDVDKSTGCFNNLKSLREKFTATYAKGSKSKEIKLNGEESIMYTHDFKRLLLDDSFDNAQDAVIAMLSNDRLNPVYQRLAFELINRMKRKNVDIREDLLSLFRNVFL